MDDKHHPRWVHRTAGVLKHGVDYLSYRRCNQQGSATEEQNKGEGFHVVALSLKRRELSLERQPPLYQAAHRCAEERRIVIVVNAIMLGPGPTSLIFYGCYSQG